MYLYIQAAMHNDIPLAPPFLRACLMHDEPYAAHA